MGINGQQNSIELTRGPARTNGSVRRRLHLGEGEGEGGTVTNARFVVYDEDGTAHDEAYGLGAGGKAADEGFYQRAQDAIAAEQEFVTQFVETGNQDEVETIAGASLSYRRFRSAVADAVANN